MTFNIVSREIILDDLAGPLEEQRSSNGGYLRYFNNIFFVVFHLK